MTALKRLLEAEILSTICAAASLLPISLLQFPESLALGLAALIRLLVWLAVMHRSSEGADA